MATRVWNMKPLGWGEYWEAVCAVREGGKRNHARRRKRRRCRTMTDSFLAGAICHNDIGRKIGERRWGGAQSGEGSRSRWWQRESQQGEEEKVRGVNHWALFTPDLQ